LSWYEIYHAIYHAAATMRSELTAWKTGSIVTST
jgi:hypothetical protein